MIIEQRHWDSQRGWRCDAPARSMRPQLVLVFGDVAEPRRSALLDELREIYRHAPLAGCSSAGEIWDDHVHTDSLCSVALQFRAATVAMASVSVKKNPDFARIGQQLAAELPLKDLRHCFIFTEGMRVNIPSLIDGLYRVLPPDVPVTGGLAGDGTRFRSTWVLSNRTCDPNAIVAIGLYGSSLSISSGSFGGWDPIGPELPITRAENQVLYEIDRQPALKFYENFLGKYAADLPTSGLFFPISIRADKNSPGIVRTLTDFDRETNSMTFAVDIPVGGCASMMKANPEKMIEGAASAAQSASAGIALNRTSLALLISCVGRRIVLDKQVNREVEVVRRELGAYTDLVGFYSYGEIGPPSAGQRCVFHNQTMTITTLQET